MGRSVAVGSRRVASRGATRSIRAVTIPSRTLSPSTLVMDKRFFLALLLTVGVILVTPRLFPGRPIPVTSPAGDSLAGPTIGATDPASATVRQSAVTTATAVGAPATMEAARADTAARFTPETLRLENTVAAYYFSTQGAMLMSAELPNYQRLNGDSGVVRLQHGAEPLIRYRLISGRDTIPLDRLPFTAREERLGAEQRLTFTTAVSGGSVEIAYTLSVDNYLAGITVRAEGIPAPAFLLTSLPTGFDSQERNLKEDVRTLGYAVRSVAGTEELISFASPDAGERLVRPGPFSWAVAKSKYFVVGLIARDTTAAGAIAEVQVRGAERVNKEAVRAEATAITPLGPSGVAYELYAGPQEWKRLVALGQEFENANPVGGWLSGVVQPFATIVMRLLLWMKATLGIGYGWILVIFGVALRLLLWPLNSKMMRTQMKMSKLAPQLQEVQKKYANDRAKQQEALMKVYAEHGMNPFSQLTGCLPALLPMPIFMALFFVFGSTIEFRGVPFLWFPDISVADPLFLIPILMGATMYLQTWISQRNMPPNPQMQMMTWMMPLMMTAFGFFWAAGLNLYWFVQNLAAIPQTWLIANERAKAQGTTVAVVSDGGAKPKR